MGGKFIHLLEKEGFEDTKMQVYGMPFLYASCRVFGESTRCIVSKNVRKQLWS